MANATAGNTTKRLSWIAQIIAAVILGQTLFFKFAGAPESIYIFEQLGVEPWGRYATGMFEVVAVVLLLTPRAAGLGALMAIGLMLGALGSHVTTLGVEVQGDGGLLFGLAITTLVAASTVAYLRRRQIPILRSVGR
ncbi:MAG: DoxX family protein [Gemmatimonadales bacterium]|nr:DoxX family protein [Gemmatimonadales bacterium]